MKGLILTYLLTYGGAIVSLFNPFVGLLIYVAFAILKPDALWGYALPQGGRYSLIVALALLVGWALKGFGSWRFGKAKSIMISLSLFWLVLLLSAASARDSTIAWNQVEALSKMLLPCFVAMTLIDSVSKLKAIAWVIVLSQGYLAYEFNMDYLSRGFDDGAWTFGGFDNNGMGIAMDAVIGLAFFVGLDSKAWWQKAIAFLAAGLMTHFVLFSMSRGGMLGLVIMGAVSFILIPKKPAQVLFFLVGLCAGLYLAGPAVVNEFMSIKQGDAKGQEGGLSRTLLWKACYRVGLENPLTGVGPGNWAVVAHEYGFTRGKASHTTWLNVWAEEGILGFLTFVSFFALTLIKLWPIARRKREIYSPSLSYLAGGVFTSIVGFAVSAQFVAIEGLEQAYFVTIVGASVVMLCSLMPVAGGDFARFNQGHSSKVAYLTRMSPSS